MNQDQLLIAKTKALQIMDQRWTEVKDTVRSYGKFVDKEMDLLVKNIQKSNLTPQDKDISEYYLRTIVMKLATEFNHEMFTSLSSQEQKNLEGARLVVVEATDKRWSEAKAMFKNVRMQQVYDMSTLLMLNIKNKSNLDVCDKDTINLFIHAYFLKVSCELNIERDDERSRRNGN